MSEVIAGVDIKNTLEQLGIEKINNGASTGSVWSNTTGENIESYSPVDGKLIATVKAASAAEYDKVVDKAQEAFKSWRSVPAPQRGEIVRQLAEKLRDYKQPLGE